jgi:phosphoglycerate dehydrogenase-like enzyme
VRILVASSAFPGVPRLLGELLPEDEIVIDAARTDGTADVVIPLMTRIDSALMDRVQPRLIQQFGVGLEGVDRPAARERGIAVANVPADGTGNADGVGELAVLHLLALSRRYHAGAAAVVAGRLGEPAGTALFGTTIVILGLGDVGRATAQRLSGFGARLVGVGTRTGAAADAVRQQLGLDEYVAVQRLHDALRDAHALIACCVLNDATRGIVGTEALAALGEGRPGYVVNVARGPVIDHDALLQALRAGVIAGAGLDVYWDEPIDPSDPLLAENVTVTPHVGGVTEQAYAVMARRVVANVEALRRGEPIAEA